MKVEKEENINHAFVLTDDEIERIVNRFEKSDYFIFKAICADGAVREFKSSADLLQYENTPNREIESLGINVFSDKHEKKAFINFSNRSVNNIFIRLEGEEKEVLDITDFLHEKLYSMGPWYAFIARIKYSGTIISTFINWILLIPFLSLFGQRYFKSAGSTTFSWIIVISLILGLGLLVFFGWRRIRAIYFPMGVFSIGQGVKRYKDKEIIRTVVILGFLISLIAGLLVLFMQG